MVENNSTYVGSAIDNMLTHAGSLAGGFLSLFAPPAHLFIILYTHASLSVQFVLDVRSMQLD